MLGQIQIQLDDILEFLPNNKRKEFDKVYSSSDFTDDDLLDLIDDQIKVPADLIASKATAERIRLSEPRIGKGSYPYLGHDHDGTNIELPDQNELEKRIEQDEKLKSKRNLLDGVKGEFYSLLCTDSKKYAAVRKKWDESFKVIFPVLAAAVASELGVVESLISGLLVALLTTIFKLPTNAWCEINKIKYSKC